MDAHVVLQLREQRPQLHVLRRRRATRGSHGRSSDRRRLGRKAHRLGGGSRWVSSSGLRSVGSLPHLRHGLGREEPGALPRVEHVHEALQVLGAHLLDAVAVERHDAAAKERRVRPAHVLEDRIGQVEDRQFVLRHDL